MLGEEVDIRVVSRDLLAQLVAWLAPQLDRRPRLRVGIMGESGSGKTSLARALGRAVENTGHRAVVLQLDDYFRLPPRDNEARRRADPGWIGPGEVDLERLDRDLADLAGGAPALDKPLVDHRGNTILRERLDLRDLRLAIVEGTYVGVLQNIDLGIFIDRTYEDTRQARLARGRETQSAWLETVLAIEHRLVRPHRARADIVIGKDYAIQRPSEPGQR